MVQQRPQLHGLAATQVAPPTGVAMRQWQRASDVRLARILERMEAFEEGRTYLPSTMAAARRAAQGEALPPPPPSDFTAATQYGGARILPWLRAAEQRARAGSPSALPTDGAPREAAEAGPDNGSSEPTWVVNPHTYAGPGRMPSPHAASSAAAVSPLPQDTSRSAAWLAAVAREAALGNEQARVELDAYRDAAGVRLHELGPAMEAAVSAAEGVRPAAAPAPVDNFWHHLEQFRPPARPLEAIPHLNRAQQLLVRSRPPLHACDHLIPNLMPRSCLMSRLTDAQFANAFNLSTRILNMVGPQSD